MVKSPIKKIKKQQRGKNRRIISHIDYEVKANDRLNLFGFNMYIEPDLLSQDFFILTGNGAHMTSKQC